MLFVPSLYYSYKHMAKLTRMDSETVENNGTNKQTNKKTTAHKHVKNNFFISD